MGSSSAGVEEVWWVPLTPPFRIVAKIPRAQIQDESDDGRVVFNGSYLDCCRMAQKLGIWPYHQKPDRVARAARRTK